MTHNLDREISFNSWSMSFLLPLTYYYCGVTLDGRNAAILEHPSPPYPDLMVNEDGWKKIEAVVNVNMLTSNSDSCEKRKTKICISLCSHISPGLCDCILV